MNKTRKTKKAENMYSKFWKTKIVNQNCYDQHNYIPKIKGEMQTFHEKNIKNLFFNDFIYTYNMFCLNLPPLPSLYLVPHLPHHIFSKLNK